MCCFGTNLYVSMYVIIIIKCLVQAGILVFFCFKTFKGEISLVFVCIVCMVITSLTLFIHYYYKY